MTPTAQELWNDIGFCNKRKDEQLRYIFNLEIQRLRKQISIDRYNLLIEGANVIYERFKERINSLVAQSGEHVADIDKGDGS